MVNCNGHVYRLTFHWENKKALILVPSFIDMIFKSSLLIVCVMGEQYAHGNHRTLWWAQSLPFTVLWSLGIKLGSPRLLCKCLYLLNPLASPTLIGFFFLKNNMLIKSKRFPHERNSKCACIVP